MIALILLAAVLCAVFSGVPGLWIDAARSDGQRWATRGLTAAAAFGLLAVLLSALADAAVIALPDVAPGADAWLGLDALSRWFAVPVLAVPPLAAWFGHGYWPQAEHRHGARKLQLAFGVMTGAMILLCAAQSSVLFLVAWEAMAIAAYFLVTADEAAAEAEVAGWHYLAAAHVGSLCLFGLFASLAQISGDFSLRPIAAGALPPAHLAALWLLGLIGFGVKAGLVPLHIWLPAAHANAPSHVSALLSGVMLKMGVFGLCRLAMWLPGLPASAGWLLVGIGLVSAFYAIAMVIAQTDLKRALAYSSIENVGLIAVGLGLALVARAQRDLAPAWAVAAALGLAGALLHVWVHAAIKPLLFFGAGTVIHATGSRDMKRLGGLARHMPRAATLFGVGALAITGLPPLGAFASEALIYIGWLRVGQAVPAAEVAGAAAANSDAVWVLSTLVVAAMALVGALALAAFVQVFGLTWLGTARSPSADRAREPAPGLIAPMVVCAAAALLLGVAPWALVPLLDPVLALWSGTSELSLAAAPLAWLGGVAALVWLVVAAVAAVALRQVKAMGSAADETWACGYAEPTPRMQYAVESFAQWPVSLLGFLVLPRQTAPSLHTQPERPFVRPGPFSRLVVDVPLDRLILPAFRRLASASARLRVLQSGRTQAYFLYMIITLIALILWR